MSAFCSKYPACGCVGAGTYCYDSRPIEKIKELNRVSRNVGNYCSNVVPFPFNVECSSVKGNIKSVTLHDKPVPGSVPAPVFIFQTNIDKDRLEKLKHFSSGKVYAVYNDNNWKDVTDSVKSISHSFDAMSEAMNQISSYSFTPSFAYSLGKRKPNTYPTKKRNQNANNKRRSNTRNSKSTN